MKKQIICGIIMLALLIGIFAVSVAAAGTMKLTVSSPAAAPGSDVTVTLTVSNNPGLASLKCKVAYDSVLTLKNVEFSSAFGANVTTPTPYKNPQTLAMVSPMEECTANGVFATLTFSVAADAPSGKKAQVTVTYDADDVFDGEYNNVPLTVVNGEVTVGCSHSSTTDVPEKPATCKEVGYTAGVRCNNCNTYISGHREIPVSNEHSYGEGVYTCTYTCSVCSNVKTEAGSAGTPGDFTGDGKVDNDDVLYLLWHTLFGDEYPIR